MTKEQENKNLVVPDYYFCGCGSKIKYTSTNRHIKTKKHLNYMEKFWEENKKLIRGTRIV